jgi:AcrR family transcriptional regulator
MREAAMELFVERGYEQTTVADIARRAGVTPRTFFRHYADKREVLFAGSELLQTAMVAALDAVPAGTGPMHAIAAALDAAAGVIGQRRDFSGRRQQVIAANRELQERELLKLAWLGVALRDGLLRRGVAEPHASLAAEAGMAVFRVAFERWLEEPGERSLAEVMGDCFAGLNALTAPLQSREPLPKR